MITVRFPAACLLVGALMNVAYSSATTQEKDAEQTDRSSAAATQATELAGSSNGLVSSNTRPISNGPNDDTWTRNVSLRAIRLKRDAATDAIAGLNLFGIAVSFVNPVAGGLVSILGGLLGLIFPGGDPTTLFRELIYEERAKQQRQKLLGFKDTMKQIETQSRFGSVERANERMLSLYDALNSDRCLFMHVDNVQSSYVYFKEFATIHLVVNQAMILIHTTDHRHWQENLQKNVREYVAYAYLITMKEAEVGRDVAKALEPSIEKWIKQLSVGQRAVLRNHGAVRDNGAVSFRLVDNQYLILVGGRHWLSCWGSGSQCRPRPCPGENNPMERGSQYKDHWRCRGEVFWIHAIDGTTDGIIKTCSRVGIEYSYVKGQNWWLSTNKRHERDVDTKTCPGNSASSMRNGGCLWEAWRIYVFGKPCGVPVKDRDLVKLISGYNGRSPFSGGANEPKRRRQHYLRWDVIPQIKYTEDGWNQVDYFNPDFTIFRSDVDRAEYSRDLPCS